MRVSAFHLVFWLFTLLATSAQSNTDIDFVFGSNETVSPNRAAKIISDYFGHIEKAPKFKTRGMSGASLYTTWAPSVVLIITDDGIGSGSIISADGLILTNWHVVEENTEVMLAFMPKGLGAEVSDVDVSYADVIHLARDKDLALLKISSTAPTAEQVAKIYNDEKFLFQENAKATLYGTSNVITALAYDDTTKLLHAGTSDGRSVFNGLRRVDNTTDAVGTSISASNGLVVDE